jgi:hypothetical protein
MTIVAKRIVATPARSAIEAWTVIVDLLAPHTGSDARKELESVSGVVSNLIADEAFANEPGVVYGSGPRVRLYCLYGEAAISGDRANEFALAFNPTEGDWRMSLPCPADDLDWVRKALKKQSSRITARDMEEGVEEGANSEGHKASVGFEIDREAFLSS